jgi:hypothetical protein
LRAFWHEENRKARCAVGARVSGAKPRYFYGTSLVALADTVVTGLTIPEMIDLLDRAHLYFATTLGPKGAICRTQGNVNLYEACVSALEIIAITAIYNRPGELARRSCALSQTRRLCRTGRPLLRSLPGNWWRSLRTWGWGRTLPRTAISMVIQGTLRGKPAGARRFPVGHLTREKSFRHNPLASEP